MDTLPPELKQRICSYLKPKDLKSLDSPRRTMLLPLPAIFCRASFFSITRTAFKREQWKSYQILASAQVKKSTEKLMLECIALAFQKCPKLRNLIIDFESAVGDGCGLLKNNRIACGLIEKRNHFYRDIFSSPATRTGFAHRFYWDHIRFDLWDILKPVHDVDRALESLAVLDSMYSSGSQGWTLPTTSIFRNLKHLRESLCSPDFLISIVACAPKLESLGVVDYQYHRFTASPLQILLEKTSLKSLRACSLRCTSNGDAIARFVLRQSGTLQSFTLGHMGMLSPSSTMWTSLAARLKGQLPHLKRLKLIDLTKPLVFDPTTGFPHPVEFLTTDDILQDHEHELQTEPMELENGLWEDYELRFFPQ
ncbi:MAG: Uncharacterized protein AUREO_045700 [Aureobasidium pullulans]|nr:MAG: Uncharacterized protein AUREO_045700 [Aureobasidium pullulans]